MLVAEDIGLTADSRLFEAESDVVDWKNLKDGSQEHKTVHALLVVVEDHPKSLGSHAADDGISVNGAKGD